MNDIVQQVVPAGMVVMVAEHRHGGEESLSGGDSVSGAAPKFADQVTYGMEAECDQVHGQQQVGQSVLAVAEIMFHVIAVVFQYVERLVLNLPTRSCAVGQCRDVVPGGFDGCDEIVFIGGFAAVLYAHRQPIHLKCVIGVAQRQPPRRPAIGAGFATAPLLTSGSCDPAVERQSVKVAVECLVGTRFGGEQEIATGIDNALADRMVSEKIIAENDRSKVTIVWQVAFNPAMGGFGLAVLLGVAVLWRDEFRTQRQHAAVAVCHQGRAQHAVMVGDGIGLFMMPGGALGALDLFRVMELRSVNGDQGPAAEPGELAKCLIVNQLFKRPVERRIQQLAIDVVEFFSDVVVGGDARDAEKRLAGMAVVGFLKAALVIQK